VPISEAPRFGILLTDSEDPSRVIGFEEKPAHPRNDLISMGIYVFDSQMLSRLLEEDAADTHSSHDFGKDIIPRLVETHKVFVYDFLDENKKQAPYWRDVGTLDAYWAANMDLIAVDPIFNLYDREWPVRTNLPMVPPAKFVFAQEGKRFGVAVDSIVSPGCIVSGGIVTRSILSPEVRINSYSHVEESILMDGASVGRRAHVRRAIVEKHVHIPENAVIGYDLHEDAKRFRVTPDGIVVVEQTDSFGVGAGP